MFDRPHLLWLLLLLPIVIAPGIFALRGGRRPLALTLIAIRTLLLVALVALIAGLRIPGHIAARKLSVVAAIDESRSIAPDQAIWMRKRVSDLRRAMSPRDELAVLGFGRDARLLAPMSDPRLVRVIGHGADPGATNIADALTTAESLFAPDTDKRILLLSDGNETEDSARAAVPSLEEAGIRVFAEAVPPSATERVALTDFSAPGIVRADQQFAFRIAVESEGQAPADATLKLFQDGVAVGAETVSLKPGLNRFDLPYRMSERGAFIMGAEVSVAPPRLAINPRVETGISVVGAPRVLIVTLTPPESLLSALKLRGYRIDTVSPLSLSSNPLDYLPYQLVIMADVPASQLGAQMQHALNRYVADLGGGLIATGDTLREDGFRGGELEKTLPVTFELQPPPPSREPIAVYLCIDRSNSMSYDSRYPAVRDGERIRYAKEAAIALLRQLDDTDFAGVIAFDSQPYVLGHLEPLGDDRADLENRIERLQPGGGTDFKDALQIAEREILQSKIAVRQVILLTDGDTNRQYHDHDDLIASFVHEKIPVSTIRIGPDLANLQLLQDFAQATGGVFYRVADIEKLPLLLVGLTREAMNRRKQDRTAVVAGEPSAILSGIDAKEVPPIDFFASTSAKSGAQVPLSVTRGDRSAPLLAAWQYGLGRAAIFAADPDSLATLSWIRWDRYAEFWSQLVTWTMRAGDAGPFTMRIVPSPDGSIAIEAEKADNNPVSNLVCRISGPARATDIAMTQTDASLYRADVGPLARGKYTVTLMMKAGDIERIIEQRQFATPGSIAADSAELRIRPPNVELLRDLAAATRGGFGASDADIVQHAGAIVSVRTNANSILLPIVILLFLGEVFVRRRFLGD